MNDWINSFLAARFLPSLTFDWVDLGAGGGQDLYLMPLHFSSGTLLKIDGRETNFNSPSNDKFLNDYIDHTKVGHVVPNKPNEYLDKYSVGKPFLSSGDFTVYEVTGMRQIILAKQEET